MTTRRTLLRAAGAVSILAAAGAAPAAEWPMDRPIQMIIPTPTGGGSDIFGRMIASQLGKALGQNIVVENRGGANGLIGQTALVKAPGDGYTILFSYTAAIVGNPALQSKMPYDTLKDLVPIAQIGSGGNYLAVTSDVPVRDARSFVDWAKAQPAPLMYGSWGPGSGGHVTMEAIRNRTGLNLTHVPYRGSGPLMTDFVGGQIKVAFVDTVGSLPHIRSGKIKALAISGSRRAPQTPEVPTLVEQGIPFALDSWYGLFAPAGTPDAVVRRINTEIGRLMRTPEMKERLLQMNMAESPTKSPEEFAATVRADLQAWSEIVRANNIRLD